MPEIPDVMLYVSALQREIGGRTLRAVRLRSPSLLRTFEPPIESFHGRTVERVFRIAKQIVWDCGEEQYLLFHLMVTGRFHRKKPGAALSAKTGHASFDFDDLSLHLTEASSKKRASLHALNGKASLAGFDRGGLDPLQCSSEEFSDRLRSERHTLKRSLTDQRLFAGIGNAYSDEILHRARLSPLQMSTNLSNEESKRLYVATQETLTEWVERLQEQQKERFPERVTAFRHEMAVHGKFRQPCPVCAAPVQRIVYAENECNYCPRCQTDGRILADRSLSRLLKDDWPKTLDEL